MNCKQFARHIAAEVEPLSGGIKARFHFWIHWAICPFCRRYWREIRAIGNVQRAALTLANHPVIKLSEIKQRLREHLLKKAP